MRVFAALALVAGVFVAGPRAAPARADATTVEVFSNFFTPADLVVPPGATVTWAARDAGHTVTADDGSFDFPPASWMDRGQTFRWTFLEEGVVAYHCRIHGRAGGLGMSGRIVVTDGPSTPAPSAAPRSERFVPSQFATIAAALDGLPPGGIVTVAPGRYAESVEIRVPDVVLRGQPGATLDGLGHRDDGVRVAAPGVRVEGLAFTGFRHAGVWARDVAGFSVERVAVTGGAFGVVADQSRDGVIRASSSAASSTAGFAVRDCQACDVVVDDVEAEKATVGVLVVDAESVTVTRSRLRDNATGIRLRSTAGGAGQRGAHVHGNVVTASRTPPARRDLREVSLEHPVGAGIWVEGGSGNRIEANAVSDGDFGVLVTAGGGPANGNEVRDNVVSANRDADLGWDGIGALTCFAGNAGPAGELPTSQPSEAQTLYDCARPTVGFPYAPLVVEVTARQAAVGA